MTDASSCVDVDDDNDDAEGKEGDVTDEPPPLHAAKKEAKTATAVSFDQFAQEVPQRKARVKKPGATRGNPYLTTVSVNGHAIGPHARSYTTY